MPWARSAPSHPPFHNQGCHYGLLGHPMLCIISDIGINGVKFGIVFIQRNPEFYGNWSWDDIIEWNEDLVTHFVLYQ